MTPAQLRAALEEAERVVQCSEWAGRSASSSASASQLLVTLSRVTQVARQLYNERRKGA